MGRSTTSRVLGVVCWVSGVGCRVLGVGWWLSRSSSPAPAQPQAGGDLQWVGADRDPPSANRHLRRRARPGDAPPDRMRASTACSWERHSNKDVPADCDAMRRHHLLLQLCRSRLYPSFAKAHPSARHRVLRIVDSPRLRYSLDSLAKLYPQSDQSPQGNRHLGVHVTTLGLDLTTLRRPPKL